MLEAPSCCEATEAVAIKVETCNIFGGRLHGLSGHTMVSFFGDISGYLFNGGRLFGVRELWGSFMTQISSIDIDKF